MTDHIEQIPFQFPEIHELGNSDSRYLAVHIQIAILVEFEFVPIIDVAYDTER